MSVIVSGMRMSCHTQQPHRKQGRLGMLNTKGTAVSSDLLAVVVTSLCVTVVAVPVVMTPSLFVTKDAPGGHVVKIGSAPVSVDEELVETGMGGVS